MGNSENDEDCNSSLNKTVIVTVVDSKLYRVHYAPRTKTKQLHKSQIKLRKQIYIVFMVKVKKLHRLPFTNFYCLFLPAG